MVAAVAQGERSGTATTLSRRAVRQPVRARSAAPVPAATSASNSSQAGRGQGLVTYQRHVGRRRLLVQKDSRPEQTRWRCEELVQVK